jgi:hypothetical protein
VAAAGRSRSRRVSLPGVAELLRPAAPGPDTDDRRRASGREKHTQKITVYLSAEELLDLERARLALLRYGAAADRGRIVREAIAVLLADLDARGKDSLLARRIVTTTIATPAIPTPTIATAAIPGPVIPGPAIPTELPGATRVSGSIIGGSAGSAG